MSALVLDSKSCDLIDVRILLELRVGLDHLYAFSRKHGSHQFFMWNRHMCKNSSVFCFMLKLYENNFLTLFIETVLENRGLFIKWSEMVGI